MKKSFVVILVILILECLVLAFNFEATNTNVVREAIKSSLKETLFNCSPARLERSFVNFFGKNSLTQRMVLDFSRDDYDVSVNNNGDWVIRDFKNNKAIYLKNRRPFVFKIP